MDHVLEASSRWFSTVKNFFPIHAEKCRSEVVRIHIDASSDSKNHLAGILT